MTMFGKCKLCNIKKELQESHIIPNFIWRVIKNHQGQAVLVTDKYITLTQDTYPEYLFCWNCEQKIRENCEDYTRDLLFAPQKVNVRVTETTTHRYFTGIDYSKFKLFQLSILWRMSLSEQDVFSKVQLNSVRNEQLRRRIYHNDPGKPDSYGCVMRHLEGGEGLETGFIKPEIFRQWYSKNSELFISFLMFGGYLWCFYVPSEKCPRKVKIKFLTKEGNLCIPKESFSLWNRVAFNNIFSNIIKAELRGSLKQRI